ncbi:MAG: hypothetical protein OXF73_04640 [Gammaproteobacteria bacterium]|nr:hypothetical protein [Gammaproteobacteria bacterium]MCY4227046.1 hypothetical protein [Gammaproteobacteria bacterium]
MSRKLFIPVTDEMLYEHPEWITAPLCPYQADNPSLHWMAVIDSISRSPDSEKQTCLGENSYRYWLKSQGKLHTRSSRA